MKLYREEILRNSMLSMVTYIKAYNESVIDKIVKNHIDALKPIEISSDEEIYDECKVGNMDTNQQLCFQLGAKWMRDKIKGGEK